MGVVVPSFGSAGVIVFAFVDVFVPGRLMACALLRRPARRLAFRLVL